MRLLSQEMTLVALAISLIVVVTLLYLKSIFISMIVNLGVGMSVGISFFAYRIVFDIDLFPFINMMAAFLLIGIACDNVYVLFDAWYNEKTRIIMEDLPEMVEKYYNSDDVAEPLTTGPQDAVVPGNDASAITQATTKNTTDRQSTVSTNEQLLPPIFIKRRILTSKKKQKKPIVKNGAVTRETDTGSAKNTSEKQSFLNGTTNSEENGDASSSPLANAPFYTELLAKGVDIADYELNPLYVRLAPLTDEQMIRVMGGTLRHAASSIFVTSFTTAAAFLTNFITKLPYVQLFGVFTGFCILIYFTMVITMVAAFVVTYEKYIQPFSCKWRPAVTVRLENWFENVMGHVALVKHRIISKHLPWLLIQLRVFWFVTFFILGVCGMFVVFYKPQLKPPQNWRHQFFENENPFESFEFKIKDQFLAYFNEERRNLTNPEIFFVFGVMNKDTGRVFNPDDDGHLIYDANFEFLSEESQLWLHHFITQAVASRTDLFLAKEIVDEWRAYLINLQYMCSDENSLNLIGKDFLNEIFLPYRPEGLIRCRDEIQAFLKESSLHNFEKTIKEFPRRIIFLSNGTDVSGILLRINANRTFLDYDAVSDYYMQIKQFHEQSFQNASDAFRSGWFISVGFALYDLQYQLITGTYSSLVASMIIALVILLLTSGNIFISIYAIITISFSIADTIAIFVFMGWDLSILESVVIIMSVGLSVDFSCHYGVAYINSDREFNYDNSMCCPKRDAQNNSSFDSNCLELKSSHSAALDPEALSTNASRIKKRCGFVRTLWSRYQVNNRERFVRIGDIFDRVGSAVLMAAFTTFLAGLSMYPSGLTSFTKMGQFLMLVMCTSYLFATFFFVPMCAMFGPTRDFGNLNFKEWTLVLVRCFRPKGKKASSKGDNEQRTLAVNPNNNDSNTHKPNDNNNNISML